MVVKVCVILIDDRTSNTCSKLHLITDNHKVYRQDINKEVTMSITSTSAAIVLTFALTLSTCSTTVSNTHGLTTTLTFTFSYNSPSHGQAYIRKRQTTPKRTAATE
jgi:hypothetical protein